MKTTILLLLTAFTLSAQDKDNYLGFTTGIDVANIAQGDYNGIFKFTMVASNVEVNLGYETYPELDFKRYSFGLGYHFPLYAYVGGKELKTTFTPSLEPSLIDRSGTWGVAFVDENKSSHLSLALNLEFEWNVTDNISVGYNLNFLPSTDLKAKFERELWSEKLVIADTPVRVSGFVSVKYKLNR